MVTKTVAPRSLGAGGRHAGRDRDRPDREGEGAVRVDPADTGWEFEFVLMGGALALVFTGAGRLYQLERTSAL